LKKSHVPEHCQDNRDRDVPVVEPLEPRASERSADTAPPEVRVNHKPKEIASFVTDFANAGAPHDRFSSNRYQELGRTKRPVRRATGDLVQLANGRNL
jgi:hypothetical protein